MTTSNISVRFNNFGTIYVINEDEQLGFRFFLDRDTGKIRNPERSNFIYKITEDGKLGDRIRVYGETRKSFDKLREDGWELPWEDDANVSFVRNEDDTATINKLVTPTPEPVPIPVPEEAPPTSGELPITPTPKPEPIPVPEGDPPTSDELPITPTPKPEPGPTPIPKDDDRKYTLVNHVSPYNNNPIKTIEVWFRAFIPNDTVSTVTINEGAYTGYTGVELNFPFDLGDPFVHLDDQRKFSNKPEASSRASAYLKFDAITGNYYTEGNTAGSTSISPLTGAIHCQSEPNKEKAEIDSLNFVEDNITLTNYGRRNQYYLTQGDFKLDASASNHCANAPSELLVPNIDFEGKLHISVFKDTEGSYSTPASAFIQLEGAVDDFPAYEVLVSVDGKEPFDIMRQGTGNNTPIGLFNDAEQEFTAMSIIRRDLE